MFFLRQNKHQAYFLRSHRRSANEIFHASEAFALCLPKPWTWMRNSTRPLFIHHYFLFFPLRMRDFFALKPKSLGKLFSNKLNLQIGFLEKMLRCSTFSLSFSLASCRRSEYKFYYVTRYLRKIKLKCQARSFNPICEELSLLRQLKIWRLNGFWSNFRVAENSSQPFLKGFRQNLSSHLLW